MPAKKSSSARAASTDVESVLFFVVPHSLPASRIHLTEKHSRRRLALPACLLLCLASAGCADYRQRSDTVTQAAGNAPTYNKIVHIADPWPRVAGDTRISGNGQRVDRITRGYLTGRASAPQSGSGSTGSSEQTAPSNQNPSNQPPAR